MERKDVVLVVDDDVQVGKVLQALLGQAGIAAVLARSGAEALEVLAGSARIDAVVTDLQMPEMDGLQLLQRIMARWPEVPVMLLTGFGTVPLAVEAMRLGATDFMLKPFQNEEVLFCVKRALARTDCLPAESQPAAGASGRFASVSPAMAEPESLIRRVASGLATVLLRGESGTGKEVAARAIHERSARVAGPFVKIHCAALPDTLLESELFGYEKGAFTGAVQRKPGRVELAEGGTLFLDEIGDITPAIQVKLLRLLQDREFERLGGTTTYKADVRLVAATHRPLEAMVEAGEMRADLFYRLNVVPIRLPPLRARPEDIAPLARHFCQQVASANGKQVRLEDACFPLLEGCAWPGNIRQLQNVIERLVVLAQRPMILQAEVARELDPAEGALLPPSRSRSVDKGALVQALRHAEGNRSLAAKLLGVSRRTLYNKLAEYELA